MTPRALVAVGACLACWLAAPEGRADPSVWARARQPELEARRRLLIEVDRLRTEADHRADVDRNDDAKSEPRKLYLRARTRLEAAGVPKSRDRELLFAYADVVRDLGDHAAAVEAYHAVLALDPPAPMAAEVHEALAGSYAQLKMSRLEIAAYDEALKLEPHAFRRARMLANRAEAFMTLGDLTTALDGYRAALASLSNHEMPAYGVTTLWGLAVASDRAGDLDEALESIRVARIYDVRDSAITAPTWFYVIPYDKHWYEALGHWLSARKTDLAAVRAESYGRAVAAWESYIAAAAPTEPWLPMARIRLVQCQKERDASAFRRKGAKSAPSSTRPAKKTKIPER